MAWREVKPQDIPRKRTRNAIIMNDIGVRVTTRLGKLYMVREGLEVNA